jgi:hypothetical protein
MSHFEEITGIKWKPSYFEPGEGKSDLDRAFGRMKLAPRKWLIQHGNVDGTIKGKCP